MTSRDAFAVIGAITLLRVAYVALCSVAIRARAVSATARVGSLLRGEIKP